MIELLGTPQALPFVIALTVMIIISLMEGLSMVFGAALSGLVDGILPDFDLPDLDGPDLDLDADIDFDADVSVGSLEAVGPLTYLMSWLSFGKAPALILLLVFLAVFGLAGLTIQNAVQASTGLIPPGWLASIPALLLAVPSMRYGGKAFGAIMPKEETEAVSTRRFVGKVATVIRGRAERGMPAEAKLKDMHGKTHWILVEPDEDGETFATGEEVLVVSQAGSVFRVIRNTHEVLSRKR
jgi:hypothetical protein